MSMQESDKSVGSFLFTMSKFSDCRNSKKSGTPKRERPRRPKTRFFLAYIIKFCFMNFFILITCNIYNIGSPKGELPGRP